jgi:hypothetical protein
MRDLGRYCSVSTATGIVGLTACGGFDGQFGAMKQARDALYRRRRFPADVIGYAVRLCFQFPLSLRMVEEMKVALCPYVLSLRGS